MLHKILTTNLKFVMPINSTKRVAIFLKRCGAYYLLGNINIQWNVYASTVILLRFTLKYKIDFFFEN